MEFLRIWLAWLPSFCVIPSFLFLLSSQTIPLEKINDVELNEGCWETCFGLKRVDIQTNGFMDVRNAALEHPEMARQAILLAAKQYR